MGNDISLVYLTVSFWLSIFVSRLCCTFVVLFVKDFYVMLFCSVGNFVLFGIAVFLSESYWMIWIVTICSGILSGPLTACCFSLPQSFFKLPISSFSVGMIDSFAVCGVLVSVCMQLLWPYWPNMLFISGFVIFLSFFLSLLLLLLLRVWKFSEFVENWSWSSRARETDSVWKVSELKIKSLYSGLERKKTPSLSRKSGHRKLPESFIEESAPNALVEG